MSGDAIHVTRKQPEAVFSLLSSELRIEILRALSEVRDTPQTFSDLRARVGERDSGKFNYHLGKLEGTFVRRTEDGYELTIAGHQVVGALIAGTYTADAELSEVTTDDPCPQCESAALSVSYESEHVKFECHNCDDFTSTFWFPGGTLDQYDPDELPAVFDRWMYTLFQQITAGFCVNCAGRLTGELEPEREPPTISWTCNLCGDVSRAGIVMPLLFHPAAQGFLVDHGIDVSTTPTWQVLTPQTLTQEADETGATVTISIDGDELTGHIDTDGRVSSVEW
ncbi:winged helix-turn-helix domain-containing protein [Haloferax sp. DFSO60]|uniref:winged helix-turn-helix domain-containing protein n=1 Tax=Haloferax sp. DFSO60 TaxID=3388652 RepID=UPI00397C0217